MDFKDRKSIMYSLLIYFLFIALIFFSRSEAHDKLVGHYVIVETNQTTTSSMFCTTKVGKSSARSTKSTKSTETTAAATMPAEIVTDEVQPTERLRININTADIEELKLLNGIGEALAERIVHHRENSGEFRNIEEIMNVYGIGEGIFSAIADFIYVDDPVYDPPPEEEPVEEISEESAEIEPTEPPLTLEAVAPIDINTASVEYLMLLPHVTEEIAEQIITMRTKIGGFRNVYEILYIESLTREEAAEIVDYICVGS